MSTIHPSQILDVPVDKPKKGRKKMPDSQVKKKLPPEKLKREDEQSSDSSPAKSEKSKGRDSSASPTSNPNQNPSGASKAVKGKGKKGGKKKPLTDEQKKEYAKSRNWCFTSYELQLYDVWKASEVDLRAHGVKYLVYQEEIGNTEKRTHLQGYVEFVREKTRKKIKKILGDKAMHLEPRKGTADEARVYCIKVDTRSKVAVEIGTFIHCQGKRTDLQLITELALSSASLSATMQSDPTTFVRYHRGLERVISIADGGRVGQYVKISCTLLVGATGLGKTSLVYAENELCNIYRLSTPEGGRVWFDGYDGQDVLLIDDFYGLIPYEQMLILIDNYVNRVQIKGGFAISRWTKIYITSNSTPDKWYLLPDGTSRDLSALYRRLKAQGRGRYIHYIDNKKASSTQVTSSFMDKRVVFVDTDKLKMLSEKAVAESIAFKPVEAQVSAIDVAETLGEKKSDKIDA